MGWTRNREVRCGCGWEGTNLEVVTHHTIIQKPIFVTPHGEIELDPVLMDTSFLCPECRADVTKQCILTEFSFDVTDFEPGSWKKYEGKSLNPDYYDTRAMYGPDILREMGKREGYE